MYQTATTQSPTHINQSHSRSVVEKPCLHPTLQAALSSLDVQLEAELARYRRRRAGYASYSPRPIAQRQIKTVDLKAATPPTGAELPAEADGIEFHPTAPVSPLATIPPETSSESSHQSSELKQLAQQYAAQVADAAELDALNTTPDDYLESSEELLRTLSQEEAQVQAEQGFMHSLLTPLGIGSMLLLLMSSALFGFVIMNPSGISQLLADRNHPSAGVTGDGTINATRSDSTQVPQPNLANQEFPELNLGNLGSVPVELGAPVPTTVQPVSPQVAGATQTANLGASGMTGGNSAGLVSEAPTHVATNEPASIAGNVSSSRKLAPTTPEPAPATKPYLPPVSSYRPPARTYSPPARSSNPPPRNYNPPPRSYNPPPAKVSTLSPAKPIPVLPAPSPLPPRDRTPLPPAPAAVNPAPASSPSSYKVVTPYTSDRTLEDYRGKVPDAYVKNYSDGAKVQFGAYQDEATAKSQVEALKQQGIPAEVYKP